MYCESFHNKLKTGYFHSKLNKRLDKSVIAKELVQIPLAESMLEFYINLCKYMSFEYDMIMYMLDILASIFIATNYKRKFFVLKGLTCNGKSKLFELMGRVRIYADPTS